jgi:hypothetical protein
MSEAPTLSMRLGLGVAVENDLAIYRRPIGDDLKGDLTLNSFIPVQTLPDAAMGLPEIRRLGRSVASDRFYSKPNLVEFNLILTRDVISQRLHVYRCTACD